MIAEILSVGTELLLGQILNTDAQYLSQQLSGMGIDVYHQATVGDNPIRLKKAFETALHRSDVVIVTGGLGPTTDDLTKETICEYLGLKLFVHEESLQRLERYFASLGREMTPNNLKQVMFPKNAIVLKNVKGTAPGLIIERKNKIIIILPGPPYELIPMFENEVKPYLGKKTDVLLFSRVLRVFGIGESKLEETIQDLIAAQSNPTIALYAGFGEVTLRLTAKCSRGEDPMKYILPIEQEIRKRVKHHIYGVNDDSLGSVVASLLVSHNLKISTAESCTGGLIASRLINVPGISRSFIEGFITYSNESKIKRLKVNPLTLQKYGAVSQETAREMAIGCLKETGADISVSVTGIAGPEGGTEDKPVGLVYIGIAQKDNVEVYSFRFAGDRERIRMMSCLNGLNLVRLTLLNGAQGAR
ncbi:MAG: competence/damage-inducible protein A [Clostridia bacterium]|jgi:nicotinamide-nucleotide amidase